MRAQKFHFDRVVLMNTFKKIQKCLIITKVIVDLYRLAKSRHKSRVGRVDITFS